MRQKIDMGQGHLYRHARRALPPTMDGLPLLLAQAGIPTLDELWRSPQGESSTRAG